MVDWAPPEGVRQESQERLADHALADVVEMAAAQYNHLLRARQNGGDLVRYKGAGGLQMPLPQAPATGRPVSDRNLSCQQARLTRKA
jgi:hypothetical protein